MESLIKELQTKKTKISQFSDITVKVLNYLPNVISGSEDKGNYTIYVSKIAGSEKFVRPINKKLILWEVEKFNIYFSSFLDILIKIRKQNLKFTSEDLNVIDRTLYTIQQTIGAGLDLLGDSNSARKHVGNRFEELIKCVFNEIGIANRHIVLKIPYDSDEGLKTYKCENDLVLSPFDKVKSTSSTIHKKEIVVSAKTTSKDRMSKIFIDKILLERFIGREQKVIGIFLNDVQRKKTNDIAHTLVSGLFMVYTNFLTNLDGVYYLDPPPNALKSPFNKHMKRFSRLITGDIQKLLSP